MIKISKIFRKPGFHAFLFLLSLILFNWPFMSIAYNNSPLTFFYFLFMVWGIILILLFIVKKSLDKSSSND
jgi:hypothetical protein